MYLRDDLKVQLLCDVPGGKGRLEVDGPLEGKSVVVRSGLGSEAVSAKQSTLYLIAFMLSEEDRKAKEAALSGLSGGSFSEIVLLLLVIPVRKSGRCLSAPFPPSPFVLTPIFPLKCFILLYRCLYQAFLRKMPQWCSAAVSVLLLILPMLISMSVYTDYTLISCMTSLLIAFVAYQLSKTSYKPDTVNEIIDAMNSRMKPFLSNYRATMMLATCFAILAVDFNLYFPTRFAKCEEYGISLMDIGVGGFIFSSALTTARSRQGDSNSTSAPSSAPSSAPAANTRSHKRDVTSGAPSWSSRMLSSLKMVVPLLVLGLGRFSILKAFGYQEHVTEYGMHWNFFMTLAGITLLTAALNVPLKYSGIVGALILCVYHFALEGMGVADWIISAPRVDFFSQNREGILSCFGYFALYLFGQQVGSYLMVPRTRQGWWKATLTLTGIGLVSGGLATSLSLFLDMHPSRRMVNLPYGLFTLTANCIVLSAFLAVDLLSAGVTPNALLDSVATKRNSQLVIFTLVRFHTPCLNLYVARPLARRPRMTCPGWP